MYRVSIKPFPDYKHLLQENYVEYKLFFNVTQEVCLQHISTLQYVLLLLHGERLIDNQFRSTCSPKCLQLFKFVISGTGVENTLSLTYPHKKWREVISGDRGGQGIGSSLPIHQKTEQTYEPQCGGAQSCWKIIHGWNSSEVQHKLPTHPVKYLLKWWAR
jgi:hypothetical protein